MTDASTVDADDLRLLRETAAAFVEGELAPSRLRDWRDPGSDGPDFDRALWSRMAELGWAGIAVPEADGGYGLGLAGAVAVAEEAGRRLLAEPMGPVFLATGLLAACPGGALRDGLLARAVAGDAVPVAAWSAGLDPLLPAADGPRLAGGRLTGRAAHVLPGGGVDDYLVLARSDEGEALCRVPAAARGLRVTRAARPDTGSVAALRFDCDVSDAILVDRGAGALFEAALDHALVVASAELLGLVRGALAMTVDYARTRRQFDRPIGSFQVVQHRLADLYLAQELSAAVLADVAAVVAASRDPAERGIAASRAKARLSGSALYVAKEAVQLHGGIGFTEEHDVGLYLKRAVVLAGWLGNAAHHARRVDRLSTGHVREAA